MSFLQQLKQQATQVQSQQGNQVQHLEANVVATEQACQTLCHYLSDLATQLNVIQPPSRAISLDGKTRWPALKLANFRYDTRKKTLRQREVTDHVALGWVALPQTETQDLGRVSVNFPPDLERVESRLRVGQVKHQRLEQRHPDTHKLQAIVFEHELSFRASLLFTPDHDQARFQVRLVGVTGLEVLKMEWRAAEVTTARLDDLAKAIVGQPSSLG